MGRGGGASSIGLSRNYLITSRGHERACLSKRGSFTACRTRQIDLMARSRRNTHGKAAEKGSSETRHGGGARRGRREDDAERWLSHPKEIRAGEEEKRGMREGGGEERRKRNKRKKVVLRSPHEDLPTQDHDKITLQNPLRKDHIAFVRSHGTRAIWPSTRSRFPFLHETWPTV